jgi:hypothetical protein
MANLGGMEIAIGFCDPFWYMQYVKSEYKIPLVLPFIGPSIFFLENEVYAQV